MHHEDCCSSLGRPQDGHAMLHPFFQPRYSIVLNEKSNNLLPAFSRCAAINYYTLYSAQEMGIFYCHSIAKMRICCSQLHCIEFNAPFTNLQHKIATRKKRYAKETNQIKSILFPRHFDTAEPDTVVMIFKGLMGKKMLALRLRTSMT